jgi:hypothetical protein
MPPPLCARTGRTLALLLCVGSAAWLAACDTEDTTDPGTLLDDVLSAVTVNGTPATLISDPFPDGGSCDAPEVSGSSQIVRGGSLLLNVQTGAGTSGLLLGIEDLDGYFESNLTATTSTVVITSKPGTTLTSFTLLVAKEAGGEVCTPTRFDVVVNPDAGASDELQVSLNWGAPVDLDLHLETPDKEDIYWGNPSGEHGGTLDLDSNSGCTIDNVNNENISWGEDTPPSGEYVVRVDLWSACDETEPIPFVVTVNLRGEVSTYTGTFDPSEADQGGKFSGREITRFTY